MRIRHSAANCGRLVGVIGQTIYSGESETSRPRKSRLVRIASLRHMGKREALAHLKQSASRNRKESKQSASRLRRDDVLGGARPYADLSVAPPAVCQGQSQQTPLLEFLCWASTIVSLGTHAKRAGRRVNVGLLVTGGSAVF